MDGGRVTTTGAQICPAKLLIFDLSTDKLVKRLILPFNISSKNGEGALTSAVAFATDCKNIIDTMTVSILFLHLLIYLLIYTFFNTIQYIF